MKPVLEGLLFIVGEDGLDVNTICNVLEVDNETAIKLINDLKTDYESEERGIRLEYLGEKFKLTTKEKHKEYYKRLVSEEDNTLSDSSLEVLAIIAYNGPITRIDVDNIRGVNSSYIVRKLLLKGLIEESGRSDSPGRPRMYKVTLKFLDYFGLGSLDELPKLEIKETSDDDTNLFESKYKEFE